MWKNFINFIFKYFFDFENNNEEFLFLNEEIQEQENEPFISKKKKIILIILFLLFISGLGYYIYFLSNINITEIDILDQLKTYTDVDTYNKIVELVKNIYENPYYRVKDLNYLRYIQLTSLITKTENYEELVKSIEQLIEKIEKDLQNEEKYTSYK